MDTELVAVQETRLSGKKCDAARNWLAKRGWKSVWSDGWGTEKGATAGGVAILYKELAAKLGQRRRERDDQSKPLGKSVTDREAEQKRKQAQVQPTSADAEEAREVLENAMEDFAAARSEHV